MMLNRRRLLLCGLAATTPAALARPDGLLAPQLGTVDGGMLEWSDAGPAGRRTLVLEAGLSETLNIWRTLVPLLARGDRVLTWNRPGLGRSTPRDEAWTPASHAAALQALLRLARVEQPVVLVGHAAGSLMAEAFARRHPEAVAGLVLVDPMAFDQDALLARHDRALALQVKGMTQLWPGAAGRELRSWNEYEAGMRRLPAYAGPALALLPIRETRGVPRSFARARRDAVRAEMARFARGRIVDVQADAFVLEDAPDALAREIDSWLQRPA
jgi:pimeloyl-ACP methyl ester carboxylesterase